MDFWRLSTTHLFPSFSTHQPKKRILAFLIFFRALFSAWPCTEYMQQHLPTLPPASHRARTHQLYLASHWHLWNLSQVPVTCESLACDCALLCSKLTLAQWLCKGSSHVLVRQLSQQPIFTLGHASWAAKTSESGKESPASNNINLASQICKGK